MKKACEGPEFRQFDFWIGSWIVRDPSGKQVGTSEINAVSGSCAIREQWKGAGGTDGTSLNYYDPAGKRWHQDWVGSDGTILQLEGGMEGKAMVMSARKTTATVASLNRITWTPLAEGKVKQAWDVSEDDGKTWKPSFVGIYGK